MNTNAIDILKQDHQTLISVMNNLERAIENENDKVEDLFQDFKKTFSQHDEAEDKVLYPALKEIPELKKLVLKARQAHHVVQVGLLELRVTPYASETWGPKFLVIKDSLLTHMQEEEQLMFTSAEKLLAPGELERLAQEIAALRDKAYA